MTEALKTPGSFKEYEAGLEVSTDEHGQEIPAIAAYGRVIGTYQHQLAETLGISVEALHASQNPGELASDEPVSAAA